MSRGFEEMREKKWNPNDGGSWKHPFIAAVGVVAVVAFRLGRQATHCVYRRETLEYSERIIFPFPFPSRFSPKEK